MGCQGISAGTTLISPAVALLRIDFELTSLPLWRSRSRTRTRTRSSSRSWSRSRSSRRSSRGLDRSSLSLDFGRGAVLPYNRCLLQVASMSADGVRSSEVWCSLATSLRCFGLPLSRACNPPFVSVAKVR